MNDKQMLEMAAKAAGYSTSKYWHNDGIHCSTEYAYTDGPHGWNPLTDDGDALRLAVTLGLLDGGNRYMILRSEEIGNGLDPYAATRRAITRAAAEIGRARYEFKATARSLQRASVSRRRGHLYGLL